MSASVFVLPRTELSLLASTSFQFVRLTDREIRICLASRFQVHRFLPLSYAAGLTGAANKQQAKPPHAAVHPPPSHDRWSK